MEETGAALAQPPKSSSSATEGAGGLDAEADEEAPQPAPTSLAVSVSGSFIIEEGWEAGGAAGSGSLQAFEPQGSMAAELRLAMGAAVLTGCGGGAAGLGAGLLRLNAELRSG